jgi:DNA-binding transcriptional MerR regulator
MPIIWLDHAHGVACIMLHGTDGLAMPTRQKFENCSRGGIVDMNQEKRSVLLERLRENWDTISDFFRQTGIPLSQETVRRALYENEKVSTLTFIVLAKYLGFSPAEIRGLLKKPDDYVISRGKERRYASELADLIVERENAFTQREDALIQCVRIVTAHDPEIWNLISHFFSVINRSMGLKGLEQCIKQMEHSKTKKGRARLSKLG